jgi:DNA-binding MarR family transcriptional regulator
MEKRLKDAGLPPLAWYDVLWILERTPDQRLRMSALADQLVLTRFNVTRLVDRLVEAGLVARRQTKEDGRGFYAVLTEKGRALRKQMWTVYRPAIVELFNRHLSAAQHATCRSHASLAQAPGRFFIHLGRTPRGYRCSSLRLRDLYGSADQVVRYPGPLQWRGSRKCAPDRAAPRAYRLAHDRITRRPPGVRCED